MTSDDMRKPVMGFKTADLGRNGPVVSRFGLGTVTFGAETDEADARRQLDLFTSQGVP